MSAEASQNPVVVHTFS